MMFSKKAPIFLFFASVVFRVSATGNTACFGVPPYPSLGGVVPLSAARECYGKIILDSDSTIQGIDSILGTLKQFYAFYNYAVDAPNSSPLNNPDAWAIYNGTRGGQVNLAQKQQDLVNRVEKNGATLLTIMDLATASSAPRDAHISSILYFMNNAVLRGTSLVILDQGDLKQIQAGKTVPGRYLTLEESDGIVSVVMKSNDTDNVIKIIDTIDGVPGVEYLEGFVSIPEFVGSIASYKALGSRMQKFLQSVDTTAPIVSRIRGVSNVFDSLPDSVNVQFRDGSSSTWVYLFGPGQDSDGNEFVKYTVDELTAYANTQPEDGPYVSFNDALIQAGEIRSIPDYPEVPAETGGRLTTSSIDSIDQDPPTPMNWTFFTTKDSSTIQSYGTDVLFAVTSVEDATVLKFQVFSLLDTATVADSMTLCKYLYDFAESNGNTKLIIDLTDNGGGNVDQTFAMTQCLYPQATYDQLYLPYELRWSTYRGTQFILEQDSLAIIKAILSNEESVKAISEVLSADIPSALVILRRMRNVLKAMKALGTFGNFERDILTVSLIIDEVMRSKHFRTSFVKTLLRMPDFSQSVTGVPPSLGNFLNGQRAIETVTQGGIETTIWTNWTRFQPTNYVQGENLLKGTTNPYKSYAIIGNGLGGSSSSTFEMNVIETSELNPTWTPAKSYTYGCVGKKESCPVNQFQGGTIGRGSDYSQLSYGSVGWFVFLGDYLGSVSALAQEKDGDAFNIPILPDIDAYVNDVNSFIETVPEPPELATTGFNSWQFTVYSVLSKITGFNSIAAEYFQTPPTEYIPFWPDWTKAGLRNNQFLSSTLLPLYSTVARDM